MAGLILKLLQAEILRLRIRQLYIKLLLIYFA